MSARTGLRVLVAVAGADSLAMREQSRLFVAALESKKLPVSTFTAKGRGHFELVEGLGSPGDETTEAIAAASSASRSRDLEMRPRESSRGS